MHHFKNLTLFLCVEKGGKILQSSIGVIFLAIPYGSILSQALSHEISRDCVSMYMKVGRYVCI